MNYCNDRKELEAMIANLKKVRTIRDVEECPLVDVWLEESEICPETNPKGQLWWCTLNSELIRWDATTAGTLTEVTIKRIIEEINSKAWYFIEDHGPYGNQGW